MWAIHSLMTCCAKMRLYSILILRINKGQIPTLSIDVKNPHIGLLALGRAQAAWLSYSDATGIYPLFHGRLVALPSNLLGEVVTLQFLSKPDDFLAQKQAIANELAIEPWFDPIWISSDKLGSPDVGPDPDTVLENYTMAWHVDRTTLAVSVSDIIFGEDGTEVFGPENRSTTAFLSALRSHHKRKWFATAPYNGRRLLRVSLLFQMSASAPGMATRLSTTRQKLGTM